MWPFKELCTILEIWLILIMFCNLSLAMLCHPNNVDILGIIARCCQFHSC